MSIIYNALQKTQRNLGHRRFAAPKRDKVWLDVTLLTIIALLLTVIAFSYYPVLKKHVIKPGIPKPVGKAQPVIVVPPPLPAPPIEMDYQGKLVLNGVFLSEQEKVALINNQPMHLGDMVDGKKIIAIEINKVKLQDANTILVMRTVS